MRIAVASKGKLGLEDAVSAVFGRCPFFTICEISAAGIVDAEVIKNPVMDTPGGAGVRAAQMIIDQGVDVVIAGDFGPNTTPVFLEAGIDLIPLRDMVVDAALKKYLAGDISPILTAEEGLGLQRVAGRKRGGDQQICRVPDQAWMPTGTPEERFVCPGCGCTMPKNSPSMKCPNCGKEMG